MVRKPQRGRLSSVPFGHPLRFFRSARFFLCGKLLTWLIRQVGSKKSPRVRGGFFSVLMSRGIVGWIYRGGYVLFYRLFYLLFYIEKLFIKAVF